MLQRASPIAAALLCLSIAPACTGQSAMPSRTQHRSHPTGSSLERQIAVITQEPAVARAHWGISVTTLDGTPVVALNQGQFFQPASNAKLFTTAAAMALLPMQQRLTTEVYGTGEFRKDGTLEGDLELIGVGDTNLSGRPLPYAPRVPGAPEPPHDELRYIDELADKIKASGITRVTGNVIGDDTAFPWDPYPADWAIDDAPWYYGAPINALMVADNAVTLRITPGTRADSGPLALANATITPNLPYYALDIHATTGPSESETRLDIQRAIGERTIHVYGTIAADAQPYTQDMSIADPAEYAALALKAGLQARGIAVGGEAVAKHQTGYYETSLNTAIMQPLTSPVDGDGTLLGSARGLGCDHCGPDWASRSIASHLSDSWYEDLVVINKNSQNQHAEVLLRQLGRFHSAGATTVGGARVVRTFLTTRAGIDPQDFFFYDGSGLSGHDIVTPRAITQLLRYAAAQPWGAQWKATLPIGGVDGSLRNRFHDAPLQGHVFAKTGTLGEARALSGYLDCASGRTVVFSIMVGTHTPLNNEDQNAMDRIVAAIAATE